MSWGCSEGSHSQKKRTAYKFRHIHKGGKTHHLNMSVPEKFRSTRKNVFKGETVKGGKKGEAQRRKSKSEIHLDPWGKISKRGKMEGKKPLPSLGKTPPSRKFQANNERSNYKVWGG